MMSNLTFGTLPDLPQITTLKQTASALWEQDNVAALWLGGSFARGEADEFSDIDLRVAVRGGRLTDWPAANLLGMMAEHIVGKLVLNWDRTVLHHLVLENGVIVDLLVQSINEKPPEDFTFILGCRNATLGALLAQASLPPTQEFSLADPEKICQAVTNFWIGSHKHSKVLHRRLDLLALIGLGLEQPVLMRLWYAAATGRDMSTQSETIHTLTPTVRAIMENTSAHSLKTLGSKRMNRSEIMRAIETNRDEVAQVGRELAERLGFDYPDKLEHTVRESWRRYLATEGEHSRR